MTTGTGEVEEVLRQIQQNLRAERNILRKAHLLPDTGGVKQNLARIQVNLSITERAWNRLPPILSERSGRTARFEMWVKRFIKRLTHWFTWEQVNFNAAVNKSLQAVSSAFVINERQHADTRLKLEELSAKIEELSALKAELEALRRSEQTSDKNS